jgi:hypothetical protein
MHKLLDLDDQICYMTSCVACSSTTALTYFPVFKLISYMKLV